MVLNWFGWFLLLTGLEVVMLVIVLVLHLFLLKISKKMRDVIFKDFYKPNTVFVNILIVLYFPISILLFLVKLLNESYDKWLVDRQEDIKVKKFQAHLYENARRKE